jgi:cyclophilin family peptidyl-prolyl cis-trans isomerase
MVNTGIITTKFGDIKLEFYHEYAPKTVENFKELTTRGFYDGLIFHRIVPEFVIQGGDPNTKDKPEKYMGNWRPWLDYKSRIQQKTAYSWSIVHGQIAGST